jgi:hypothetical protein
MRKKGGIRKLLSAGYTVKAAYIMSLMFLLSSCTVKTNMYSDIDTDYVLPLRDDAFNYWELELVTDKVLWDQIDFAFGIGYNIGEDEDVPSIYYGYSTEIYTYMWEFRVSARWFPLRKKIDVIKPYIGFGVGYFDFAQDIDYDYYDDDWYYYDDDYYDTIASGFFPFFSAGLYLPIGKDFSHNMQTVFQLEYRNDFNKDDNGIDLSGEQLTLGFGITWK